MLGLRLPWDKHCPWLDSWSGLAIRKLGGRTPHGGMRVLRLLRHLIWFLEPCIQSLIRISLLNNVSAIPLTVLNALNVKFSVFRNSQPQMVRAVKQGFIWMGVRPKALISPGLSIIYGVGLSNTSGCYIGQTSGGVPGRWPRHARALASRGCLDGIIHLKWYSTLGRRFASGAVPWCVPLCEVDAGCLRATKVARTQIERNAIRCMGRRAWNSAMRVGDAAPPYQHVG